MVEAFEGEHPDVIIIEGQGALSHPAYLTSTFILRGSRPHGVILQHAPARTRARRLPRRADADAGERDQPDRDLRRHEGHRAHDQPREHDRRRGHRGDHALRARARHPRHRRPHPLARPPRRHGARGLPRARARSSPPASGDRAAARDRPRPDPATTPRTLVDRLGRRGIARHRRHQGDPRLARGRPGSCSTPASPALGDSRIENIERLRRGRHRRADDRCIRSPMLSQVDRVVAHADVSCNTELDVLARPRRPPRRSGRRATACVLMVELGDLREGILPADLARRRRAQVLAPARTSTLRGIGTNLACQSGVAPDAANMAELSALADVGRGDVRRRARPSCPAATRPTSTGRSAAADIGRVNDLRLGESILLGREPLHRRPDRRAAHRRVHARRRGHRVEDQAVAAVGRRSARRRSASRRPADRPGRPAGGSSSPSATRTSIPPASPRRRASTILGASSDHLVLDAGRPRSPSATRCASSSTTAPCSGP